MAILCNSLAELENAIRNELQKAINETHVESYDKVQDEFDDYYNEGSPRLYIRTGRLGNSLQDSGVTGGGNNYQFTLEMVYPVVSQFNRQRFLEKGYSSWFTPQDVMEATESGSFGHTKGKHHYWERSLQDIEKIMNKVFGTHFR